MSSISRAREAAQSASGEFLDNETLAANQQVFVIIDVIDDQGGGYQGKDAWRLKIEPYSENEDEPNGILTLTDNPARRKFMTSISGDLDEKENKGEEVFIGPCVLVRLKSKNFRYYEIVDWDEKTGRPVLPEGVRVSGKLEEETRVRRPQAQSENGTEETARSQRRPFVPVAEAEEEPVPPTPAPSAEKSRRATRTSVAPSSPESAPSTPSTEFPPIKEWARLHGYDVPEGRGRVKNEVKEAYERAKRDAGLYSEDVAPIVPLTSRSTKRRPEEQLRPAEVPVGAPTRDVRPPQGGASQAQEQEFRPGMQGTSLSPCPDCQQIITDRIFPTDQSGEYALIHTCPATNDQAVLPALPISTE